MKTDMNDEIYDDMTLEAVAEEAFGVKFDIKKVIVRNVPTSHTTHATVFLTTKNQLFVLIHGQAAMTLGDIRKMVKRMGLVAEAYLPPAKQPDYFHDMAVQRFKSVYPGRHNVSETDLAYYRLSSPYNPALVQIGGITDGTIKQFDSNDSSGWRTAAKFQYKRIKTD